MKLIIAGPRDYDDYEWLCLAMLCIPWVPTEIVSGGATGADALGERWAREHGCRVKVFHADWRTHGRAAGPIRNGQMGAYADALLALGGGFTKGTRNMISVAQKRLPLPLPYIIVSPRPR